MPFPASQILDAAFYAQESIEKKKITSQIDYSKPLLDLMIKNLKNDKFNMYVNGVNILKSYDSNYTNYTGADEVTVNRRDPIRQAKFQYGSAVDGFMLDEDELIAAGIPIVRDGGGMTASKNDIGILVNKIEAHTQALNEGMRQELAFEMYLDGTQSSKAMVGLSGITSLTPTVGTLGGIAATNAFWQNNVLLNLTTGNMLDEVQKATRLVRRYTPKGYTNYFCGGQFYDQYEKLARANPQRFINIKNKGGIELDVTTNGINIDGVPLIWDPTLDALDDRLGVLPTPFTKRCYGFQDDKLMLVAPDGHFMNKRKPDMPHNRFVIDFKTTTKQALVCKQRNSTIVMSIA